MDANRWLVGLLVIFPKRPDPPEAGSLLTFSAGLVFDCCCWDVDPKPRESGFDGGGPAGVVDVFPNANVGGGLLVGVEVPNAGAEDVLSPKRFLLSPPPKIFFV